MSQKSKYIFGIDLGTTYSVISYLEGLESNYQIRTCPNPEGRMLTPSVVYMSDDAPIVGQIAKDKKVMKPHSVLDYFKRQMGKGNDKIYYGENYDKATTAIDLSAEVLKYLAKYAEDETDSKVDSVVITVPAYFETDQKKDTEEAARRAGFSQVNLIEEPTAAAFSYGQKGDKHETVLVYDLGGGTFDIVAVEIDGYKFDCFAVEGDVELGGKNWDERMQEIIKENLKEKGIEISELGDNEIADIQKAAEVTKINLTNESVTDVELRIGNESYEFEVTRKEFEDKTKDLLDRTIERTKKAKERAEKERKGRISKILLVGGSSYMPQVKKRLELEFSDEGIEVTAFRNPNMVVSQGAANYGKVIIKRYGEKKTGGGDGDDPIKFEIPGAYIGKDGEIEIPSGIPTVTKVSASSIGIKGKYNDRFVIKTLLKRGAQLPTTSDLNIPISREAIAAGRVELSLFEHRLEDDSVDLDNAEAGLKELNKKIGDISKDLPEDAKMHIHMTIDEQGLLKITATDPNGVEINLETTADIGESE